MQYLAGDFRVVVCWDFQKGQLQLLLVLDKNTCDGPTSNNNYSKSDPRVERNSRREDVLHAAVVRESSASKQKPNTSLSLLLDVLLNFNELLEESLATLLWDWELHAI